MVSSNVRYGVPGDDAVGDGVRNLVKSYRVAFSHRLLVNRRMKVYFIVEARR